MRAWFKNDTYWNNFAVKGVSLKDHNYKKNGQAYQDDILKHDSL